MEPQDPKLPGGVTGAEIDEHLDGGDPPEIDEKATMKAARKVFKSHADNIIGYHDPQALHISEQDFTIDDDGDIAIKFEFTIWVKPCTT